MSAVLVVVSGLPGTGKSTVASTLAASAGIPFIRVDRIEQAIVAASELAHPLGPVGYLVAYQLAGEQLSLGLDVVVECVNPLAVTRNHWMAIAEAADAGIVEVELICSDPAEHRRRVETRLSDVDGLVKPSWTAVLEREYEQWSRPHLVVDSATTSVQAAVEEISKEFASAKQRL